MREPLISLVQIPMQHLFDDTGAGREGDQKTDIAFGDSRSSRTALFDPINSSNSRSIDTDSNGNGNNAHLFALNQHGGDRSATAAWGGMTTAGNHAVVGDHQHGQSSLLQTDHNRRHHQQQQYHPHHHQWQQHHINTNNAAMLGEPSPINPLYIRVVNEVPLTATFPLFSQHTHDVSIFLDSLFDTTTTPMSSMAASGNTTIGNRNEAAHSGTTSTPTRKRRIAAYGQDQQQHQVDHSRHQHQPALFHHDRDHYFHRSHPPIRTRHDDEYHPHPHPHHHHHHQQQDQVAESSFEQLSMGTPLHLLEGDEFVDDDFNFSDDIFRAEPVASSSRAMVPQNLLFQAPAHAPARAQAQAHRSAGMTTAVATTTTTAPSATTRAPIDFTGSLLLQDGPQQIGTVLAPSWPKKRRRTIGIMGNRDEAPSLSAKSPGNPSRFDELIGMTGTDDAEDAPNSDDRKPAALSNANSQSRAHLQPKKLAVQSSVSSASTTFSNLSSSAASTSASLPRNASASSAMDRRASSSSAVHFRKYQADLWATRYSELRDHQRATGHCFVEPSKDRSLARWIKRQRCQRKLKHEGKRSTMTDARERLLDGLGFVWDSHEVAWESHYLELLEYIREKGHCNVPTKYADNPSLGTWVKDQRRKHRLYSSGQPSSLTPERIERLNKVNFKWDVVSSKPSSSSL